MFYDDTRLRFVEPQFRERVAERMCAIEEFLAKPGRKNATRLGKGIGLSANGFYKLVRAWRARQEPCDLVGRGRRPNQKLSDHEKQHSIIREVIAEGREPHDNLAKKVALRAEMEGVSMLSDIWIYDAARNARRDALLSATDMDISLNLAVIDWPVLHGPRAVRPHIVTAIDIRAVEVIGVALCIHAPTTEDWSRAFLSALDAHTNRLQAKKDTGDTIKSQPILRMSMPDKPSGSCQAFADILESNGVQIMIRDSGPRAYEAGNRSLAGIAADVLGPVFLKRRVRTHLSLTPIERRLAAKHMGVPVCIEDAEDYILHQIQKKSSGSPFARLQVSACKQLRAALQQIVATDINIAA